MTRITNTERTPNARNAQNANARKTRDAKPGPMERADTGEHGGIVEPGIAHSLIAGLPTQEFGAAFAAEPRFQAIMEDVRGMIERDEKACKRQAQGGAGKAFHRRRPPQTTAQALADLVTG